MFEETTEGPVNPENQAPAGNESAANVAEASQPLTKFEEAVAYVVSRDYAPDVAKAIVEEVGWRTILESKEKEVTENANAPAEMRPLNSVNDEAAQQELPSDSVKCPTCGVNYAKGDTGCPNCGTPKPR